MISTNPLRHLSFHGRHCNLACSLAHRGRCS
nr:MAG TPA: hypothetical protein [Caudoviricetes sp.]